MLQGNLQSLKLQIWPPHSINNTQSTHLSLLSSVPISIKIFISSIKSTWLIVPILLQLVQLSRLLKNSIAAQYVIKETFEFKAVCTTHDCYEIIRKFTRCPWHVYACSIKVSSLFHINSGNLQYKCFGINHAGHGNLS